MRIQYLTDSEIADYQSINRLMHKQFLQVFSPERCGEIHRDFPAIDQERSNWLRALKLSDWHCSARLAWYLFEYFQTRGFWDDVEEIWHQILNQMPLGAEKLEVTANLYHQLGILLSDQGKLDESQELFRRGLELSRENGWAVLEVNGLFQMSVNHRKLGQYQQAKSLLNTAVPAAQKTGLIKSELFIRGQLATISVIEGKTDQAIKLFKESIKQWERISNEEERLLVHTTLHSLGRALLSQGRHDEACKALEQSLDYKLQLISGDSELAQTRCVLGQAYIGLGLLNEAEDLLIGCIHTFTRLGNIPYRALARKNLAILRLQHGQYLEANILLKQAKYDGLRSSNPHIMLEIAVNQLLLAWYSVNGKILLDGLQNLAKSIRAMKISLLQIGRLILRYMYRTSAIGKATRKHKMNCVRNNA